LERDRVWGQRDNEEVQYEYVGERRCLQDTERNSKMTVSNDEQSIGERCKGYIYGVKKDVDLLAYM